MTPLAASRRARALLERVLRQGGSLADEYPLVFGPNPSGHLLALEESGEVHAACAVLVRDLLVGGLSVRTGMIGSVVTDPAWRGLGLATRLLEEAERELAKDGCVLALLWADDASFYEKRGWRPVGAEVDFALDGSSLEATRVPAGVRAAAPDDYGAIHRLYTLHRERVERSPKEAAALLRCDPMETLVLQRSKDIVAYSCMGRGADFGRTVHEWAGAPQDVLGLVRAHFDRASARGGEEGPVYVLTPPTSAELHSLLGECGATRADGVVGHGKLLDVAGAADLLARIGGSQARFEVDAQDVGHQVSVHGPVGGRSLVANELLELLLPAAGDQAAIEALRAETGLEFAGLPLPVWVWGLDSI